MARAPSPSRGRSRGPVRGSTRGLARCAAQSKRRPASRGRWSGRSSVRCTQHAMQRDPWQTTYNVTCPVQCGRQSGHVLHTWHSRARSGPPTANGCNGLSPSGPFQVKARQYGRRARPVGLAHRWVCVAIRGRGCARLPALAHAGVSCTEAAGPRSPHRAEQCSLCC